MINKILNNFRNWIGWSTDRHIIVFESDDWGSIRTRSLQDREEMEAIGLDLHSSIFPKYDCLESNDDLERLLELLSKHKDSTGRAPVFTPMCVMANPNFEKIEYSGFTEYFNEPFPETCKRYSNHDRVHRLWKEGVEKRLFVPALHAREHLNVLRWMNNLQDKKGGVRFAFDHQSIGVSRYNDGVKLPEYLGAFYSQDKSEYPLLYTIAKEAGEMFADICGYKPMHFIGPNEQPIEDAYRGLVNSGVKYITNAKNRMYPKGNGQFGRQVNWLGKHNREIGYTNITRNGEFEQVIPGKDWISHCLKEINLAYRFKKPCIISTHRVHYVGGIEEKNATEGLHKLDILLAEIMKRWPDTEFMTSTELGDLITNRNSKN